MLPFQETELLKTVCGQIVCLENILELFKRIPKNKKDVLISFFEK